MNTWLIALLVLSVLGIIIVFIGWCCVVIGARADEDTKRMMEDEVRTKYKKEVK